MAPTLYMSYGSPAVRAVLLCAKASGIELKLKEMNVIGGDNLTPEFLKINPQHTVPTLVDDNGFALWDSHAIMIYLVEKYGKDKALYPKELEKRVVVDQRLHFDSYPLFGRGNVIMNQIIKEGKSSITEKEKLLFRETYEFADKFLQDKTWIAGDSLTIADFSIVASITSWSVMAPVEESKCPRLTAWIKRMEKLPYYEECNGVGLSKFRGYVTSKLKG